jgi:hypothetical protein
MERLIVLFPVVHGHPFSNAEQCSHSERKQEGRKEGKKEGRISAVLNCDRSAIDWAVNEDQKFSPINPDLEPIPLNKDSQRIHKDFTPRQFSERTKPCSSVWWFRIPPEKRNFDQQQGPSCKSGKLI